MKSKILFLGGIHGVGKTTVSKMLSSCLGIENYKASELIGWNTKRKLVANIQTNQEVLIKNLNLISKQNKYLLLEGHFSLLNTNKIPVPIDLNVFKLIDPITLLLLKNEPKVIRTKLKKRDNNEYSIELINKFQEIEEYQAKLVSSSLNIPLKIFFESEVQEVVVELKSILNK